MCSGLIILRLEAEKMIHHGYGTQLLRIALNRVKREPVSIMEKTAQTITPTFGGLSALEALNRENPGPNLIEQLNTALKEGLHPDQFKELADRIQRQIYGEPSKVKHRCVITGIGAVTPLGNAHEFFERLLNGETAIDEITLFDHKTYPFHLAAEVKDFQPERYLNKRQINYLSRVGQMAVSSALMALKDSGYEASDVPSNRDVVLGSGTSAFEVISDAITTSPYGVRQYDGKADKLGMAKAFIAAPSCAVAKGFGIIFAAGRMR